MGKRVSKIIQNRVTSFMDDPLPKKTLRIREKMKQKNWSSFSYLLFSKNSQSILFFTSLIVRCNKVEAKGNALEQKNLLIIKLSGLCIKWQVGIVTVTVTVTEFVMCESFVADFVRIKLIKVNVLYGEDWVRWFICCFYLLSVTLLQRSENV